MKFSEFTGNVHNINAIKKMIQSNRICSAFIFEGASGSGKSQFARTLAKAVVCTNGVHKQEYGEACGTCNSCRKFDIDVHPDVTVAKPETDKVDGFHIEQIRNIIDGLYLTPNDSDMKVYILEDAQKMSLGAQNALLKSLEEPPPFAVFILISSSGGLILETVKSRAVKIKMDYINSNAMYKYLKDFYISVSPEKIKNAVKFSNGSIGTAINILNSDVTGNISIDEQVKQIIYSPQDKSNILAVMQSLTQKTLSKSELLNFYFALEAAARDIIVGKIFMNDNKSVTKEIKEIDEAVSYFSDYSDIENLVNLYSTEKILHLIKKIHKFKLDLDYNVNTRLNVMGFFAALQI